MRDIRRDVWILGGILGYYEGYYERYDGYMQPEKLSNNEWFEHVLVILDNKTQVHHHMHSHTIM